MITIHDVEQGSEEWHDLHDGIWSGSTVLQLLKGKVLPTWNRWRGNKFTKRGKLLEKLALTEFSRETGLKVHIIGWVTNSIYPNAGYSPDGFAGKVLLEVKCLNGEYHEALVRGEIPTKIMAQIQFGMVITGLREAKLIAYNPDAEVQLAIHDIPYDKKIANNIRRKLRADMKNRKPI